MTDFTKAKIGFALALLGVLFAIYPLIDKVGTIGLTFFGFTIQIQVFYFGLSLILGLSIYAYAIDFLAERPSSIPQKIGNVLYAIALAVPPFFLLLWIASQIIQLVVYISHTPYASSIGFVLSAIISGLVGNLSYEFLKRIVSRDKTSRQKQLTKEEMFYIERAYELHRVGHYDLSILEASRAIESALMRVLSDRKIAFKNSSLLNLVEAAHSSKIISEAERKQIDEVRKLRNRVAHSGGAPITKSESDIALNDAVKILGVLDKNIDPNETGNNGSESEA